MPAATAAAATAAAAFTPFATGPTRPKQVLSLGFYRTGSQSLKEALTQLGYRDVFHSSAIAAAPEKWPALAAAADGNIACLPSYNGRAWTRADWDAYFGPSEALTDLTPFSLSLLAAYPEARVILVHRDFDAWARSFLRTLVLPSSQGLLAWLSAWYLEPLCGLHISQTAWKMYMGLVGVCDLRKTRDPAVLRAGYERHYDTIRRIVPKDRLLELDLKDLDRKPLCAFLGKDVPKTPFPRRNESKVFRNEFKNLHLAMLKAGLLIVVAPTALGGALLSAGIWFARSRGYF